MSNPQNPLAKYRSYSYHHILVMCDTTAAAENLSKVGTDTLALFLPRPDGGKYDPQPIKGGNYVVLINGMIDSDFIIESLSWGSIFAPTGTPEEIEKGQSFYTSMATDGEMTILEPRGIHFYNVLVNAANSLNTDPNAIIYMIKTVFVGHTDSGGVDVLGNYKPIIITPYDIVSEFKVTGGEYIISFVGATNGAADLPQVSYITEGMSLSIQKETTIPQALASFQVILNTRYQIFRENVAAAYVETNSGIDPRRYKNVRYVIEVEDDPDDGYGGYLAGTNSDVTTQTKGNDDPVLSFGENASYSHCIDMIMKSSLQVMEDSRARKNEQGEIERFTYKIISTVESTNNGVDTDGNVDGEYIVKYRIQKYRTYVTDTAASKKNEAGSGQNQQGRDIDPLPGQFIEYDYFYTGKNTDILEMNLKMEMGMSFFQLLTTSDSIPNYGQSIDQGTDSKLCPGPMGGTTKSNPKLRQNTNTPLFPGTSVKNALSRNHKDPISTSSFDSLLRRFSSLESIGIMMKIHGNPQLMSEMISLPSELDSSVEPPTGEATGMWTWKESPGLVKVNIKAPASSDTNNGDFTTFWYDGFYVILGANNSFVSGEFTQELELIAMPVVDDLFDSGVSADDEEVKTITRYKVSPSGNITSETVAVASNETGATREEETVVGARGTRNNKRVAQSTNSTSRQQGAARRRARRGNRSE